MFLLQYVYTFLLCTYTSTVSALALALSLLSHYHLTSSEVFFLWSEKRDGKENDLVEDLGVDE